MFGAPLLHPTIVYLKCHEGEGVHGHARVQCSERCWPTGCYELYTGRVAKPLTYIFAYVCVYARIFARMHTHIYTHTHEHRHSPPQCQSVAELQAGASERPTGHTHATWISNLLLIFVFPLFFTRSPSTVSLTAPNFAPKLFMYSESGLRGGS